MLTVFVVTVGDYSDRSNVVAFTTKKAAERAVEHKLGDSICELLIDPTYPLPPKGKKLYSVYPYNESYDAWENSVFDTYDNKITLVQEEISKENSYVRCWSENEKEAIKIAKERLNAEAKQKP